ncbi:MAG: cytochrome P450 [Oculatellaceae cyanobacterium Prado106]|jgi:unspecific monooxygenase|nr:cytochrome P450 [Oculatellaceae cyanobacterium Prado106]
MNTPPVVNVHPLVQLLKWTFAPLDYLDECCTLYGDCFVSQIGSGSPKVTFLSHPDAIAELYAPHNASNLVAGRGQLILKLVLGRHSSMLLDGKEHRRHRQLVMPSLHGERMRVYGDTICQITQQVTQEWQAGQTVKMHSVLSQIALQAILKSLFGLSGAKRDRLLAQKLRQYLDILNQSVFFLVAFFPPLQKDLGAWSPYRRFLKMTQELDELIYEEIRDRRANLDPNAIDALTMLLQAQDETGVGLSDEEIRDEMLTLLFAGYDSSASVFSWAFYYIHAHPAVKTRLLAELDSLSIDSLSKSPDPNEIVRLPYLTAVCSESMRLRSAVPSSTPRIANVALKIQNYDFPPESILIPALHLTHHRPDLYPNPRQFNPDRFLERRYSPAEYNPYGGGSRYCVGAAFASFQMKLVIATILRNYQLELADKRPIQTMRRGVNVSPKGGVNMIIRGTRIPTPPAVVAVA